MIVSPNGMFECLEKTERGGEEDIWSDYFWPAG